RAGNEGDDQAPPEWLLAFAPHARDAILQTAAASRQECGCYPECRRKDDASGRNVRRKKMDEGRRQAEAGGIDDCRHENEPDGHPAGSRRALDRLELRHLGPPGRNRVVRCSTRPPTAPVSRRRQGSGGDKENSLRLRRCTGSPCLPRSVSASPCLPAIVTTPDDGAVSVSRRRSSVPGPVRSK